MKSQACPLGQAFSFPLKTGNEKSSSAFLRFAGAFLCDKKVCS
jgi:hypothetical protein